MPKKIYIVGLIEAERTKLVETIKDTNTCLRREQRGASRVYAAVGRHQEYQQHGTSA